MHDREQAKSLGRWLLVCAALVAAMVLVGGITRVTGSGLSIPRWRVVTGIVPPLTSDAWAAAFDEYRATPEFAKVNGDITIDGFRRIFLVEWGHRLLARTVVLVFVGVVVVAWRRRAIPPGLGARLAGVVALFLLQGIVGWWMVASGLVDRPSVSPLRMAVHLDLALLLFALLVATAIDATRGRVAHARGLAAWLARVVVILVLVTATWGALMAGLHAGFMSDTFPTMMGAWIPDGLGAMSPAARNLFDNPITVHFTHRVLAVTTLLAAAVAAVHARARTLATKRASSLLLAAVLAQLTLGVLVIALHVPRALALGHQAGALLVLAAAVALERAVAAS